MSGDKYLLSIDPGLSTGVALFRYSDDEPAVLANAWQFRGGAEALRLWAYDNISFAMKGEHAELDAENVCGHFGETETLVEKFTARPGVGFAHTTDALEPLRCEGVLLALGLIPDYEPGGDNPNYAAPILQYWAGGKDKKDRKKRQHQWLKNSGEFYVTGGAVGAPDADDVRSAIAHGLAWFRRNKHLPTLTRWFKED